jgi:hypothetical protein
LTVEEMFFTNVMDKSLRASFQKLTFFKVGNFRLGRVSGFFE